VCYDEEVNPSAEWPSGFLLPFERRHTAPDRMMRNSQSTQEAALMGVYLPGSPALRDLRQPAGGKAVCPWCGEAIDWEAPFVFTPSVHPILLHIDCAADLGDALIADAREALLAAGTGGWGHRAAALVRYRLTQQEQAE
jgi:hypothetical protein